MRWEYMTLELPAQGFFSVGRINGQELTDRLNKLGGEGWELVNIFGTNRYGGSTREVYAILKRPEPAES